VCEGVAAAGGWRASQTTRRTAFAPRACSHNWTRAPLCVPRGFNADMRSPSAPASCCTVAPHLSSDTEAPLLSWTCTRGVLREAAHAGRDSVEATSCPCGQPLTYAVPLVCCGLFELPPGLLRRFLWRSCRSANLATGLCTAVLCPQNPPTAADLTPAMCLIWGEGGGGLSPKRLCIDSLLSMRGRCPHREQVESAHVGASPPLPRSLGCGGGGTPPKGL
jgi:hypothetical protein